MRHSHPSLPGGRAKQRKPRPVSYAVEHVTRSDVPIKKTAALLAQLRAKGVPERDIPRAVENLRNRRATRDIQEVIAANERTRYGIHA